ncbi:DUF6518 family protein [Cellulomonas oligotrophica]|uniref:Uncharacterized protein n=1 Tax=Cellulomonas oligotrophica TaxID=931536 RepID=A0A7Y9FFL6_9CELL|nr:DUF6518 family protein [Cellulomonas oligotrophica]NYD86248.1 hypothetical protein [Cellulomonas oligotrophica]GIG34425.1 hypothetical protein Col01nite_35840 [Cellulomonas oligotrophica]
MTTTPTHPDAPVPTVRPADPARRTGAPRRADVLAHLRAAAAALALGLAVGVATSFLQTWLPAPFTALANGVAPWLVAPFVVGLRLARGWWSAPLLGVLACVAQVAGYYLTSDLRGFAVGSAFVVVWTVAGVVGGAAFGAAGLLHRAAQGRLVGLGAATVGAVWGAEALVTFTIVLGYHREAVVHAAVGLALLLLLAGSRRQIRPALAWLVPILALGALPFLWMQATLGGGLTG